MADLNAKLIDLVSKQEALYHPFHHARKNRPIVDAAWSSIACELRTSVELVKILWASLRTNFLETCRISANSPRGSSAVAQDKWPYYQQMMFLGPYIKYLDTVDNLPELEESPQSDSLIAAPEEDHSVIMKDDSSERETNIVNPADAGKRRHFDDSHLLQHLSRSQKSGCKNRG